VGSLQKPIQLPPLPWTFEYSTLLECRLIDTMNTGQYIGLLTVNEIVTINIQHHVSFAENMNEDIVDDDFMEQFGHINILDNNN